MMAIKGLVQRKSWLFLKWQLVGTGNMTAKAFIILAIKKALSATCSK